VSVIGLAWSARNVANVARELVTIDDDSADDFDSITVQQAAASLGVSGSAVTARLRRGSLHGRKDGSRWFVCAEDLTARAKGVQCPH
jgi:hypothetical protein